MPTYEYHCNKCELNFDVEQRMTDDALTIHEECGGDLVKVFSSVGIVWKGAGFYKTDARTSSSTKSGKKESSSKSEDKSSTPKTAEKSASSSSDSKSSDNKSSKPDKK